MITPELANSRFMKAARCEPTDTTPIWLMRQAGRYMPEYMAVRNKVTFLELCKTPELAAQVTLEAREILGVDAAILFADLLPILQLVGFDLTYEKGEGPQIHNPFREPADLKRIQRVQNIDDLGYVFDAIQLIRKQLPPDIPLLGFAGAPFTLASYAIEGGGSRNYLDTKRIMYSHPEVWDELMNTLVDSVSGYLNRQLEMGCQAVQIFDSWAGCLSPDDYRHFAFPYTKRLISSLPADTPVINFLTGNPALLPLQVAAGGTVQGLDWRVDMAEAWKSMGYHQAVQGNLDPASLFCEFDVLKEKAQDVLDKAAGRPGHIFNLGHGIMPGVNPQNAIDLVKFVHEAGAQIAETQI
ncbi:uroporphyrinogen decarboxylase [Polystyrenella longa]|nr:uroporphyrinogen decarboxylase [Polystyrenella longa]